MRNPRGMRDNVTNMTKKEFINKVTNSDSDFLGEFINILNKHKISFCIVGGLAVNAYAEPVVSLDLDVVVVVDQLTNLVRLLKQKYKVVHYPNSINIATSCSDLRIQIQTDPRYQLFIKKALMKNVLGYRLPVACIEDVLRGKVWAALDPGRRPSKRQKDLSDIQRLIETKRKLVRLVPQSLKSRLL
ncbi:MAG: hypothetical protein QME51_06030 [Planctomycetota bacterium]|nr:hypothetical protein [Planctomycetota bacterium]